MEIISIEKQTVELLSSALEELLQCADEFGSKYNKKLSVWMDNSEVCQLLNISKRTLQTYRDNGILPYSQIDHKMFYKPCDVEKLLNKIQDNQKKNKHIKFE